MPGDPFPTLPSPYTSHGHLIPGAVEDPARHPGLVARCGGPGLCERCAVEATSYQQRYGIDPAAVTAAAQQAAQEADVRLQVDGLAASAAALTDAEALAPPSLGSAVAGSTFAAAIASERQPVVTTHIDGMLEQARDLVVEAGVLARHAQAEPDAPVALILDALTAAASTAERAANLCAHAAAELRDEYLRRRDGWPGD